MMRSVHTRGEVFRHRPRRQPSQKTPVPLLPDTLKRWVAFALIAATAVVADYPSLYHIARADHWYFLSETSPYDSWGSMVNAFYSYPRVRAFNWGDVVLFRPLLFSVMSTEACLFGWNFFWWQLAGIAVHLAAVYAFLRLAWAMHRGLFAGLLTLFFATFFIGHMAVTWNHINGYVLFMVFLLGGSTMCSCTSRKARQTRGGYGLSRAWSLPAA